MQEEYDLFRPDAMSLKLRYSFTTSPTPIRASPQGGNANTIDLSVLVTAPAGKAVALRAVVITIPVGDVGAPYLSPSPQLPAPTGDATPGWKITTSGGTAQIKPFPGTTGQLDGAIAFTLPKIVVDDTPAGGVVGLTIHEFYSPDGDAIDDSTYTLVKEKADFVVVDFHASPPVLTDIGKPVTLYWTVDDAGRQLGYRLTSDDGTSLGSFDAADGVKGVPTDPLKARTTFTLDVIGDGEVVLGSVPLTVRVEVPWVSGNSYTETWLGSSNRIVAMHWGTVDTGWCTVQVDGTTIDQSAPADTYSQPYPLAIGGAARSCQPAVTAYAATSGARYPHTFPDVGVADPVSIGISSPGAVAITPDSKLAFAANFFGQSINVIDLGTRQLEPQAIAIGGLPYAIAITPDGATAFVSGNNGVTPIDIAHRTAGSPIVVSPYPQDVAVAADGSVVLAAGGGYASIMDLPSRTVRPWLTVGSCPLRCAITPDSKLGLVANLQSNNVSVITLPHGVVEPSAIAVGGEPSSIAITPDGQYALVFDQDNMLLSWIDIDARALSGTPIRLPWWVADLAISADGALAVAALSFDGAIGLIDLTRRRASATTIPVGAQNVVIAHDGSVVVVSGGGGVALL